MSCAFQRVLDTFKIESLRDLQQEALEKLVNGQDVFIIQPTGSGKSLIFQSAPIGEGPDTRVGWNSSLNPHLGESI